MSERPDPRERGVLDAYQDACKVPRFASIGGLELRGDPQVPRYILNQEAGAYLDGYTSKCLEMYGENWKTCEFDQRELTDDELLTNAETMRHILSVRALLAEAARELLERGDSHDESKLRDPEVSVFAEYTEILEGLVYGSDEYKATLAQMKPALDHHYAHNSHHPEHFGDEGIAGMNLFDLLEMLLDWKASTLRHADSDLNESLKINTKRFDMPEPIVRLLDNTIPVIQEMARRSNVAASYPHVEEDES